MKNEIIIYKPNQAAEHLEVRVEGDTVWLSLNQIAQLFGRDKSVISRHLKRIYQEGELDRNSTVAFFATVQIEAGREILHKIDTLEGKVSQIEFKIQSHDLPKQGVFYEGQVFDAYELASRIIRSAKKEIILIDNYIDESTLLHLSKKQSGVKVTLLCKNISKPFILDVAKANEQFSGFELKPFSKSHDRFLILDQTEVYHLGASLKDLGKKWFAFSKIEHQALATLLTAVEEAT